MSSLTNQSSATKSLSGLSDTYSTNIVANSVEVIDEFTVDDGAVITLPANSISDSALSANVAFRNQTNTFTQPNTFSNTATFNTTATALSNIFFTSTGGNGTQSRINQTNNGLAIINQANLHSISLSSRTSGGVSVIGVLTSSGTTAYLQGNLNNRLTITGSLTPTISTQAPALSNDLSLANTAWVNTKLTGYALLEPTANPQIFTGNQKFESFGNNLPISIGSTDVGITSSGGLFISPSSGSYNASVSSSNLVLVSTGTGVNTGTLTLTSWSSTPVGLNISPTSSTFVGSVNVPTQSISDNSTLVASTEYVKNQNYITSSALTPYALLAPSGAQVYTGSHEFPTQLSSDDSTLVATTAYVKSQNYATTASLSAYAQLAGTQTFTGANTFDTATNTFNSLTVFNSTLRSFGSIQSVFPSDFRMLDSTQTYFTQMYQFGTTCVIEAAYASSKIQFSTRTAANIGLVNLILENGNHLVMGTANEIDITGTSVTLNGECTFTNTSTPIITQVIALGDNSNKIATTSFVKSQNYATTASLSAYAQLAGTQTFTGANTFGTSTNTFNSLTVFNGTLRSFGSLQAVADIRMLDSTQTYLTQMYQTSTTCVIDGNYASSRLTLSTRTAANIGLNNLLVENGNHIVLQGSASEIDITGTSVTINGQCTFNNTSTPIILGTILTGDNSTKIATTAFVKNQNYITGSSLTPYALLAPVTTQTFSGTNTFGVLNANTPTVATNSTRVATTAYVKSNLLNYGLLTNTTQTWNGTNVFTNVAPSAPIQIKNTVSTKSGGLFISEAGNYNGITADGDFSVIGFGSTVDTGVLNLTTWATTTGGIRIDNNEIRFYNPLTCWYNSLTPVPALNVYDIGYSWLIAGATFNAWTGFTTFQNVATINWNGIGGRNKGLWQVDIVLTTQNTTPPISMLIWTDVSGTDGTLNLTCMHMEDKGLWDAGVQAQSMRMSFTLEVTTIPSTYYLNYKRLTGSGSALVADTVNSRITFTRMA